MAEGRRPGGLTALAVLNFVFGGLGALGILVLVALLGPGKAMLETNGNKIQMPGAGIIYLSVLLGTVSIALLIAAGVGYLKQKRVLGRGFGNAYGILALAGTVLRLVTIPNSFGIGVLIGLVYPVLTLILLNTTFKDDLVN